ncbi:DUF1569 domain-containing protein [Salinimicrobium tongyeongense]|uniref:DUF1569 domain-containing protein n=1 Tax=Salinimicrobium tongyeongense TaxID=2809707 RepID=A0ABY6NQH9_9FLAO|nr:DUF1569 domain-containing protein [Salinimicrobium tongyeongense]UZH55172.1 DUF1569 domain-containing protein [Salinimicrobium tongyeongense]
MKSEELQGQLQELKAYIEFKARRNPQISKVPVGWHLAHSLKVMQSILGALDISDPAQYRRSFSWKKELVYLTGKIPRGKARAPKKTIPEENISEEALEEQIEKISRKMTGIPKLPKNAFFEHPYFGHIKRDETAKFLVIHTEHHLKIIREIMDSRA